MSTRSTPIVGHVLYIAEQRHPWRLAPYERLATRYHTPTTVALQAGTIDLTVRSVKGKNGVSKQQTHVYCLVDDAAWSKVQQARGALQAHLDALAAGLRDLGSYAKRLEEAGGFRKAPNPLSPTVIAADDPDLTSDGYFISNLVPRIERRQLTSHTPKMLRGPSSTGNWETTSHQRDHFLCPDAAAWERIQALVAAVQRSADAWKKLLQELGTYAHALADGRYRQRTTIPQLDLRAPAARAPAPADVPTTWPALGPLQLYGHHRNARAGGVAHIWTPAGKPRAKLRHITLCHIVMTEAPRRIDPTASGLRLCAECRKAVAAPATNTPQQETAIPGQSHTAPASPPLDLPADLIGWRWSTNPKTNHYFLMHPKHPTTFTTRQYPDPTDAIAEARRWVLSQPKARPIEQQPTIQAIDATIRSGDVPNHGQADLLLTPAAAAAKLRARDFTVQPHGLKWIVLQPPHERRLILNEHDLVLAAQLLPQLVDNHIDRLHELLEPQAAAPAALAATQPDIPGTLSTILQDCARRYVEAREKAGNALLEMSHHLAEARRLAKHGDWYIFLQAIGTSEDQADRLLDIHTQAEQNPQFADAIRRNFLNPTTAALLARPSTPAVVVEAVLSQAEPPSKRQVEQHIQEARGIEPKSRTGAGFELPSDLASSGLDVADIGSGRRLGPGQPAPAPWPDPPEGWRWNRRGAPAHLIAPDGWRTADYNYPERALAEAQRRIISQPKAAVQSPDDGPKTDAGRVGAIRRYLAQQGSKVWTKEAFDTAHRMASDIHDGDTYRQMVWEIHQATNGGNGMPERPPEPGTQSPIDQLTTTMATALEGEFGIPVEVDGSSWPWRADATWSRLYAARTRGDQAAAVRAAAALVVALMGDAAALAMEQAPTAARLLETEGYASIAALLRLMLETQEEVEA